LGTLLQAGRIADQPFDNFLQRTSVPGLSVLTSGPFSPACANLLNAPKLPEVLLRLEEEYGFILIDTPPVLQLADARAIGRHAGGVILVVRAGHTAREAAAAAHQRIMADGTPVLGLILNDWNPKLSSHGYYADYTREYADAAER
jgi:Mrp family chromosome partitioning ATPase